jgi:hypothetical protein
MALRRPVASAALLVYLLTAGVAALDAQNHEPEPKTAPTTTKPSPAKPPDMSTIVERIQKRIDDEVLKPASARTAPKKPVTRPTEPRAAAASPADRRIRLRWRVSLIWPEELIAER